MSTQVSEKPWSDYKESDYTLEQWHNACLIHQHDGAPTSKAQCKLPVRTPEGVLNRAGVHAAAGALAGARGGVNASPEEIKAAKRALTRCYAQMNEKAPPSMMQSDIQGAFLSHLRAELPSSSPTPASTTKSAAPKKGGNPNFDESKVKRDGQGQFAKKSADTTAIDDMFDQEWIKNQANWENVILQDAVPDLKKAVADARAKYPHLFKAPKEFQDALVKQVVDIYNKHSDNFRSPSQRRKIEYYAGKHQDIKTRIVTVKGGGVPKSLVKKRIKGLATSITTAFQNAVPGEDARNLFNPRATIDNSQVIDRTVSHADTGAGNTTAVIVALPAPLSDIRLVGDEDKHATILFFGETASLPADAKSTMLNTLEQASKIMSEFAESVQGIQRLGSDNPPALVAMLSNRCLGQFRDILQLNPQIQSYLSNAAQYPNYTPHVTLAYPDYQGEAQLRELAKSIYRVKFDRLALWWNDEHYEFGLDNGMSDSVNEAMHADEVDEDFIAHTEFLIHASEEPTVQDIYDSMSQAQKDLVALIVGAAAEDVELPDDPTTAQVFDSLSVDQRNVLDFIVGNTASVEHLDEVGEFLAHHGVKGQKWGIRRERSSGSRLSKSAGNTKEARAAARAKVKSGSATLSEAHLAAIKSKGHRTVNAFLGDKTYWKRSLVVAGIGITGVAATALVPAALPAHVLAAIGLHSAHAGGATVVGGHVLTTASGHPAVMSTVALGKATLSGIIGTGTGIAVNVAGLANSVSNVVRAVRGNARVDASFAKLGSGVAMAQRAGSNTVRKVLNQNGSISKKLLHEDDIVDNFLAHHGVKGQKWGVRRDGISAAGYRGSGVVRVGGKLSSEEGAALASLAANSHIYSGKTRTKVEADLKRVNAKYDPNKFEDDNYYAKYREETRKIYEKHLNTTLPSGLHGVVMSHPDLDRPGYVVIGNKKGLDQEVAQLKKEGFYHSVSSSAVTFTLVETKDDRKFITDISLGDQLSHGDVVDNFLAHHGIKGMKWGIRRSESQLSRAAGRPVSATPSLHPDSLATRIRMRNAKPGSIVQTKDGQLFLKKADGKWRETHLSADAERTVKTSHKALHEMSDREINEAAKRAKLIEDYNKFFSKEPDANKELKAQVERLELQKKYSEIHSVLHPSRRAKAAGLIASSAGAYKAYQKLNKESGGELGKALRGSFVRAGLVSSAGKHSVGVAITKKTATKVAETVA